MNELRDELNNNGKAYFLTILAVVLIVIGDHSDPMLSETGKGLLSAALFAFQVKPAPLPGAKPQPST